MRYTEVCNVKISEGRQGKIDNAEMQETCYTFAEKLGGNDMNVKRRRISEAARCLCETDASVLEIAISYGYESSQAFSQAFKQLYKMTCTQFRREQQYYALQHPLQLHELNQTESAMRELQIRQAVPRDMNTWMQLMRQGCGFLSLP